MLTPINELLQPIEKNIREYQKYIRYLLIGLSFASLPLIFFPEIQKDVGEQSWNLLLLILFLPIISKVFGLRIAQTLLPLRKELGILMGTLAFVHGAGYNIQYPTFMFETAYWWQNGMITYLGAGFLALLFTIPLWLTSNIWAMKKLGKNWKILHRAVYGVVILTVIHIVLIKWFKNDLELDSIALLIVYFVGKTLEWKGITLKKKI